MYTLTQHFRSPDWTGKVEDQYVTEREALDAYADASWAYAHAPDGPRKVTLRAPDDAIVRHWPRVAWCAPAGAGRPLRPTSAWCKPDRRH